jgi:hypothetical protein
MVLVEEAEEPRNTHTHENENAACHHGQWKWDDVPAHFTAVLAAEFAYGLRAVPAAAATFWIDVYTALIRRDHPLTMIFPKITLYPSIDPDEPRTAEVIIRRTETVNSALDEELTDILSSNHPLTTLCEEAVQAAERRHRRQPEPLTPASLVRLVDRHRGSTMSHTFRRFIGSRGDDPKSTFQSSIVDPTPAVIDQLSDLHPGRCPMVQEDMDHIREQFARRATRWEGHRAVTTDQQALLAALNQGKGTSAAGPSGLSKAILRCLARRDTNRVCLLLDAAKTNILSGGKALLPSTLVSLSKPNSKIRPIAIGETLRRVVLRAIGSAAKRYTDWLLRPYQATQFGTYPAFRAIHHWAADNPAILKLDSANAFNTLRRDAILSLVDALPAELGAALRALYTDATPLFIRGAPVESAILFSHEGVQQGCPLGPLTFQLGHSYGMARVLEILGHQLAQPVSGSSLWARDLLTRWCAKADLHQPDVLINDDLWDTAWGQAVKFPNHIVSYIDDITIQGHPLITLAAASLIDDILQPLGMRFETSKTAAAGSAVTLAIYRPFLPDSASLGPSLSVLGAPIATSPEDLQEAISQHHRSSILPKVAAIHEVAKMDPQLAAYLLRQYLLPKVNFLAQVAGDLIEPSTWAPLDTSLNDALRETLGLHPAPLGEAFPPPLNNCWREELALPMRLGGADVKIFKQHARLLGLRAYAREYARVRSLAPDAPLPTHLKTCLAEEMKSLAVKVRQAAGSHPYWSDQDSHQVINCFVAGIRSDNTLRIDINRSDFVTDIWLARPDVWQEHIPKPAWLHRMEAMYGIHPPLMAKRREGQAAHPGPAKGVGYWYRHEEIHIGLKGAAEALGISATDQPGQNTPHREPVLGLPDTSEKTNTRADITFSKTGCSSFTVDVTVVSGLGLTLTETVKRVRHAETEKRKKHGDHYYGFLPFALSSTGIMGTTAREVLDNLTGFAKDGKEVDSGDESMRQTTAVSRACRVAYRYVRAAVAAGLARGNLELYRRVACRADQTPSPPQRRGGACYPQGRSRSAGGQIHTRRGRASSAAVVMQQPRAGSSKDGK